MPKLRSRLRVLMAEKSLLEKRRITYGTVAEETHLSRPTIIKLGRDEIAQIKGEVIASVCTYFDCEVGDLLYVEN
ncbi:MAG: helix-turn-helix transcriptional regulator [Chloroflexota bacterium]